jgi:hypothetical protein
MRCTTLTLGNGVTGFVCTSGRTRGCDSCGRAEAVVLCDFPLTGAKAGKTCDRAMCRACAVSDGPGKDLCPMHARSASISPAPVGPVVLHASTARVSYSDSDRLDITRKSGEWGIVFAPSWAILRPALDGLKRVEELRRDAKDFGDEAASDEARDLDERTWAGYVAAYTEEMRRSYRDRRAAWARLLAIPRAVLVCYCPDPERCHRTVLARDILQKLGATFDGEVGS